MPAEQQQVWVDQVEARTGLPWVFGRERFGVAVAVAAVRWVV